MKIKEQTRKLAAGCSKQCFEVVERTDEVSSKYCFEVADGSWHGLKRFSKNIKESATNQLLYLYFTCLASSSCAFLLDSAFSFIHFSWAFWYSSAVTALSWSSKYLYRSGSLVPLLPEKANGIVNGTILDKIGRPVSDVVGIIKALSVNQACATAYLS